MKRVAIVDDENIYLDSTNWALKELNDVEIVGSFLSAEELIDRFDELYPDIVIMDLSLPGLSGVEAIAVLKSQQPKTLFLVLTNHDDNDILFDALKAGADGYLLKSDSFENLKNAIHSIFDGGSPVSPAIARKLISYFSTNTTAKFKSLSEREHKVLQLLVDGFLYKEIAAMLNVTIDTIKKHTQSIYDKLHVRTRSEAIAMYFRNK